MKRFLLSLSSIVFAMIAIGQPSPPPTPMEAITVTGTGRATVTPDRFVFNVGVQTAGPTVDGAAAENNRRVAAVITALKDAGALLKDIQTSQYSIYPQQFYQEGKPPTISGYQVTNNVTVRSAKIKDAGRLLGVAVAAGVNNASGISFEVSDPSSGRDQGLLAAFEDARAKAALLAKAAGRTLGRAVLISEGVQSSPPPMPMQRSMAMEAKLESSDVPIEPGTQQVTYVVTVSFEMR